MNRGASSAWRVSRVVAGRLVCTAAHGPGQSHLPTARLIILGVFAVIIAGNVLGGIAGHVRFGWLIPVVVLGSVFVRLARR
jgi:hypothetical protein